MSFSRSLNWLNLFYFLFLVGRSFRIIDKWWLVWIFILSRGYRLMEIIQSCTVQDVGKTLQFFDFRGTSLYSLNLLLRWVHHFLCVFLVFWRSIILLDILLISCFMLKYYAFQEIWTIRVLVFFYWIAVTITILMILLVSIHDINSARRRSNIIYG